MMSGDDATDTDFDDESISKNRSISKVCEMKKYYESLSSSSSAQSHRNGNNSKNNNNDNDHHCDSLSSEQAHSLCNEMAILSVDGKSPIARVSHDDDNGKDDHHADVHEPSPSPSPPPPPLPPKAKRPPAIPSRPKKHGGSGHVSMSFSSSLSSSQMNVPRQTPKRYHVWRGKPQLGSSSLPLSALLMEKSNLKGPVVACLYHDRLYYAIAQTLYSKTVLSGSGSGSDNNDKTPVLVYRLSEGSISQVFVTEDETTTHDRYIWIGTTQGSLMILYEEQNDETSTQWYIVSHMAKVHHHHHSHHNPSTHSHGGHDSSTHGHNHYGPSPMNTRSRREYRDSTMMTTSRLTSSRVTLICRYASQIWTLDTQGYLYLWSAESGLPTRIEHLKWKYRLQFSSPSSSSSSVSLSTMLQDETRLGGGLTKILQSTLDHVIDADGTLILICPRGFALIHHIPTAADTIQQYQSNTHGGRVSGGGGEWHRALHWDPVMKYGSSPMRLSFIQLSEVLHRLKVSSIICCAAIEATASNNNDNNNSSSSRTLVTGHEDGKIVQWECSGSENDDGSFIPRLVLDIALYRITGIVKPTDHGLWVGLSTGRLLALEQGVPSGQWYVRSEWQAHTGPISFLALGGKNGRGGAKDDPPTVVSLGTEDRQLRAWDALLRDSERGRVFRRCLGIAPCLSETHRARLGILSWNVNAARPSPAELDRVLSWALPSASASEAPDTGCDLLFLGLQEVCDLGSSKELLLASMAVAGRSNNSSNTKPSNSSSSGSNPHVQFWTNALRNVLGTEYEIVAHQAMVGLLSFLLIRTERRAQWQLRWDWHCIKTGMGRRRGNKGAVLLRLLLNDSTMMLLGNLHLAAGHKQTQQRNTDVAFILKSILPVLPVHFGNHDDNNRDGNGNSETGDLQSKYPLWFDNGGDGTLALDYPYIMLLGDLNYRIALNSPLTAQRLDRETILRLIRAKDWEALWPYDQLTIQRHLNPHFSLSQDGGFIEPGTLCFRPTYKFDPGTTGTYDSSPKARIPAWCDRILLRDAPAARRQALVSATGNHSDPDPDADETLQIVRPLGSEDTTLSSDHKPISCLLSLPIRTYRPAEAATLLAEYNTQQPQQAATDCHNSLYV